ncbi:MAG: hypothetical protein Q4A86_05515, partial [Clostridia bacterium]|nr:hypothetical protein [Clostridia bacterium]
MSNSRNLCSFLLHELCMVSYSFDKKTVCLADSGAFSCKDNKASFFVVINKTPDRYKLRDKNKILSF